MSVSQLTLSGFFRRVAVMLHVGIPVHAAFDFNSTGGDEPELDMAVATIVNRLESGWRLSRAMAEHPRIFSRISLYLVRAGEESGMLNHVIEQLAVYLERAVLLQRKLRAVFTYPAMLLVLTFVIVAVLGAFVFPREKEMLESMGAELPMITKVMMFIMETFFGPTTVGLAFVAITLVVSTWPYLGLRFYDRHLRLFVDTHILRIPVIGPVFEKAATARVLSGLSTLLRAGMVLTDSLPIVAELAGNRFMRGKLLEARESMLDGRGLYTSLRDTRAFSPMVLQFFRIGEEQGNLDELTFKAASMLEEDVERSLEVLASLLEPIAMLIMGVVIGFVVLASALPTMDLVSNL